MKKKYFLACLLLMVAGCTGVQIRDNVLLPLASEIYEHVYPQIELGLADAVQDGDLTQEGADLLLAQADALREALRGQDRTQILAIDWNSLEAWAARGVQDMIDDGTISPGVATSLLQRIVNFRDLLAELGVRFAMGGTRPIYSTTETVGGKPAFVGFMPRVRLDWTPLDRHNEPRRALGLPEVTAKEVGLE
jgi:hypothetical protein